MTLWSHRRRRGGAIHPLMALLWLLAAPLFGAESPGSTEFVPTFTTLPEDVEKRFLPLKQNQQTLPEVNRRLSSQIQSLSFQDRALRTDLALDNSTLPPAPSGEDPFGDLSQVPVFDPSSRGTVYPQSANCEPVKSNDPTTADGLIGTADVGTEEALPKSVFSSLDKLRTFDAGYDNGIFLKVANGDDSFELKANFRSQFRLVSFSRDVDSWTNSAGVTFPIEDRENFQLTRGRLILSGHAFTPQFKYLLQLEANTDARAVVSVLDGWGAWHFSDSFEIQVGKRKVSAGRNWLLGAFDTRLAGRPIANEFFRPSRTTGVWVVGDPTKTTHYEFMVGQGYSTEGLTTAETGNNFAVASSAWWDITGNYGPLRPTDFEFHDDLAIRVGTSGVWSAEGTPGRQLEEADFLRLTDGTRLTDPGALAPGAIVKSFDVTLAAVDAAFKYRGWSANGEYFWRSVTDLKANLPVPEVGLQQGFYVEGGFFVLPKQLELNSQFGFVTGRAGSNSSYAAGFSYYPRKSQFLKLTIDATFINRSPTNSGGSNVIVGDSGVLVRAQWQAVF